MVAYLIYGMLYDEIMRRDNLRTGLRSVHASLEMVLPATSRERLGQKHQKSWISRNDALADTSVGQRYASNQSWSILLGGLDDTFLASKLRDFERHFELRSLKLHCELENLLRSTSTYRLMRNRSLGCSLPLCN